MKINVFQGEKITKEVETDKINDKDAEILEAIEKLRTVCKKYDVASYIRVLVNADKFYGTQTAPANPKKAQKDYHFLVSNLSEWIEKTTQGSLKVIMTGK